MNAALIRQFITVVPICSLTSPIHAVLALVKPEAEGKILVVDCNQRPIGVVAVYDLLLGLAMTQELSSPWEQLRQSRLATVCAVLPQAYPMDQAHSQPGGSSEKIAKSIAYQSLQDCLDSLAQYSEQDHTPAPEGSSPLRSVRCIPDSYSLHDFRLNVMAELCTEKSSSLGIATPLLPESDVEWAVVNSQGVGLGLLDQPRVWQYLALTATSQADRFLFPTAPRVIQSATQDTAATTPSAAQPVNNPRHGSTDNLWHVFVQRIEEEQAQAQQLAHECKQWQMSLQEKDDLLAYVSHEMKTPLTAVMGLAELLMVFPSAYPPERYQHYVHLIYQSSRRLIKLMSGLSDLLHIETQQLMLTVNPVAIAPACEMAYRQAQEDYLLFIDTVQEGSNSRTFPFPDSNGIADTRDALPLPEWRYGTAALAQRQPLVVTVQPGADTVMADEHCLKRLLTTLLTVALQLTCNNDGITINVDVKQGWTAINLEYPSKILPIEEQKRIFQQVDLFGGSVAPPFERIGFRLMLALRLAEQHGGTLTFLNRFLSSRDAEAQPQARMEMTVLLPLGSSSESTASTVARQGLGTISTDDASSQGSRVVVVDDDPTRIVTIADALSSLGYWGAIARSGREALNKIVQLRPVVVLLNPAISYLPDIDLLTVLRQNSQTRLIPIVAIAPLSSSSPGLIKIDGHLRFPFEPTSLHQMIVALTQTVPRDSLVPFSPPITLLYCDPFQWAESSWPSPLNPLDRSSRSQTSDDQGHPSEPQASMDHPHSAYALDSVDLNTILHPYHCRVIEVDSIDQAQLLARVWQPNLIVCGGSSPIVSEDQYEVLRHTLTAFRRCEELARLPLVTLTPKITELSHQIGLRVFPCLDPLLPVPSHDGTTTSLALIQVIQVAVDSQLV